MTDWILVGVAVASAVATVGAVLVALFGPRWWAKRRAPKLTLEVNPDAGLVYPEVPTEPDSRRTSEDVFLLANAKGRDTAREVEVFVTVSGVGTDANRVYVQYKTLNFDSPLDGYSGRATATVPAGAERPIYFLCLGDRDAIAGAHYPSDANDEHSKEAAASLACYPARADEITWITFGTDYGITLVLSGANFDAVIYEGQFRVTVRTVPIEFLSSEQSRQIVIAWPEALRRVKRSRR
jgi:hypothetical protein